jgi:dTDP-glucose 4,6-dehydratase
VTPTLDADLNDVIGTARDDIVEFRGSRIFITGGTGFVGTWFVRSVIRANARLRVKLKIDVLTRDPARVQRTEPDIVAADNVTLIQGDVLDLPALGSFDLVVHAATPASAALNEAQPELMLRTIIEGGRNIMQLAERSGAIPFLFTSSGAVYGTQPPHTLGLRESDHFGPDPTDVGSAYHEGKRVGELQCAIANATSGVKAKIARLFAFVGPYLPLDRHFAVGNFVRDALTGGCIHVDGDGRPFRSYLYASDMTSWLWRILARGRDCRAYNVGSDEAISIKDLALAVARVAGSKSTVEIGKPSPVDSPAPRYVPSVDRIVSELGVVRKVSLETAIGRTIAWHREREISG